MIGYRGDPKRLPPLFTFLAGGDNVVTCKTTKNAASKSVAPFFLCFQSGFSPFRSAKSGAGLCTRRQQTSRVDGWIDNFPPPISFLPRRCCPPLPWLWDRRPSKLRFSAPSSLSSGLASHFLVVSVMSCWRGDDAAVGRLMVVGRERVWKSVDEGIDGIPSWEVSIGWNGGKWRIWNGPGSLALWLWERKTKDPGDGSGVSKKWEGVGCGLE